VSTEPDNDNEFDGVDVVERLRDSVPTDREAVNENVTDADMDRVGEELADGENFDWVCEREPVEEIDRL